MKKILKLSGLLTMLVILSNSCEIAEDLLDTGYVIDRIEGQWKCEEFIQGRKKATLETYYITIYGHPSDASKVVITRFNNLGTNVEVSANVSGRTLTLVADQPVANGFKVKSGSGSISSSYKQINWTYSVDDGSGIPDHYTATYTRDI